MLSRRAYARTLYDVLGVSAGEIGEYTTAGAIERYGAVRRCGMSSGLNEDLTAAQRELDAAREELLASIGGLADGDLDRSRRGGWSVGRVAQHVIQSDWYYARAVAQLRELEPVPAPDAAGPGGSKREVIDGLAASRQALLTALEGIDEESLYRLRPVGREEYSVLSILENAAHHDREHAQQIRSIVAAG